MYCWQYNLVVIIITNSWTADLTCLAVVPTTSLKNKIKERGREREGRKERGGGGGGEREKEKRTSCLLLHNFC